MKLELFIALALLLLVALLAIRGRLPRVGRWFKGNRGGGATSATQPVGAFSIFSAFSWISNRLRGYSEIDRALSNTPNKLADKLEKPGILFKVVTPPSVPGRPQVSIEEAKQYHAESAAFFLREIAVEKEEAGSLYEEIEGRSIIEMFGARDEVCFAFLNEMRKCVNANVRRMAYFVAICVALAFLAVVPKGSEHYVWLLDGILSVWNLEGYFTPKAVTLGVVIMMAVLIGGLALRLQVVQQQAGREVNDFVNRYFSMLGQQYEYVRSEASKVYNEVSDENKAYELAPVWFVSLEWIAFRMFFIEYFVRNEVYQIKRNMALYVVYVPPVVASMIVSIFLLLVLAEVEFHGGIEMPLQVFSEVEWISLSILSILVLMVFGFWGLIASIRSFTNYLNAREWTGFSARKHLVAVGNLVGQYNKEIVFQRNRYKPN